MAFLTTDGIMNTSKRILILTVDSGSGHRSAANAIAAALREGYGDRCSIEIVNPMADRRTPAILRRSSADYDRIVRVLPGLYKLGYEATDEPVPSSVIENALRLMMLDVMRALVNHHRPDVIVTTYPLYQYPLETVFALQRRTIPLVNVVTDLVTLHRLWFSPVADLCLVPTPQAQELALSHGLPAERVRLTGIPVHPRLVRRERSPAELRAELGLRPELTTFLALGSPRVPQLAEMLTAVNHSGLPIQLLAVAGGDVGLYQQLQNTTWHLPVRVFHYVHDMAPLYQAADGLISKAGGLTVAEALACGLPLLLIGVIPGQETGNAHYVIEGGAGERAETPLAVLELLCHWLADGGRVLAERAARARALGRPRAAHDAAELIWGAAQRPTLPYPPPVWQRWGRWLRQRWAFWR
jgi:UDP-N-acetylglucosamine:LPS N-acetylglucosamine transferase